MNQDVFTYNAIREYKKITMDMLKFSYPELSFEELSEAIDQSIGEDCIDHSVRVVNNYKKTEQFSSIYDLTEYINRRKPILTSYGVMFENHDSGTLNPFKMLFTYYLEDRDRLKKQMKLYPKGSEDYERYHLAQLLRKINANS